ncbi:MAG: glycosyltransferase [Acidimicrobiales bacterium]|nr:glycosyltransferase [Acidimicrobiales bacterium]
MKPRRVLLAQQHPAGGSVASSLELLERLPALGIEPVVALPIDWPVRSDYEAAGARVVAFRPSSPEPTAVPGGERRADGGPPMRSSGLKRDLRRLRSSDVPQARWLRQVLIDERIDLVHTNNEVISNRGALLAARQQRVPTLIHLRGMHTYWRGIGRSLDRRLASRAGGFVAISHAVADHAATELGVDRARIEVIDNPFDLGATPEPPSVELARELEVEGQRVIAMVGRIVAWKGHEVLIDAVHQLARPDVTVLVVGAPESTYGPMVLERLRSQVRSLGLESQVRFVGARRDVPAIFALADVAVHCSVEPEPFGRVIVEAMAAGTPVVASAAGGALEIVEDGRTGRLVAPGDAGALAAALGEVLDHPDRAAAMAHDARRSAMDRFGVEAHVAAVVDAYGRAMGRSGSGRRS